MKKNHTLFLISCILIFGTIQGVFSEEWVEDFSLKGLHSWRIHEPLAVGSINTWQTKDDHLDAGSDQDVDGVYVCKEAQSGRMCFGKVLHFWLQRSTIWKNVLQLAQSNRMSIIGEGIVYINSTTKLVDML